MTRPFILLDTNVVSFMFRRDTRAELFLPHLTNKTPCIAAQTVAELHFGAQSGKWGKARYDALMKHIDGFTVLVADKETAELWAELTLQAQALGRPMAASDVWVDGREVGDSASKP